MYLLQLPFFHCFYGTQYYVSPELTEEQEADKQKWQPILKDYLAFLTAGGRGGDKEKTPELQAWSDRLVAMKEFDPYVSQLLHFRDVINRNVEPITNAEDATETLKVALAILDSAANNKIINI